MSDTVTDWSVNDKRMLQHLFKTGNVEFYRYFFKHRESIKLMMNPYHYILAHTLWRVLQGEITRLIINIPPGYTKTEFAVILFMAHGLAINPKAKFIHATYSTDLALENSVKTRDIVSSPEFQELFDCPLRKDVISKGKWYTEAGGGVYAVAAGGPVTGFRAGRPGRRFQGAFIFDDPIKPDDAFSDAARNRINNRFNNTFKSRLWREKKTPMIVIMQRLHMEDPSGYLLTGGTGEKWHHLLLPTPLPSGPVTDWYPKEYTHGIPIEYDLPGGPLWQMKHDAEVLEQMNKADPYTTASQYHQIPSPKGGKLFKDEWWQYYDALPLDIKYIRVYGDTAQETNNHNDYTVFQAWAWSPSKGIILIDQFRDKIEAPELEQTLIDFWNKQVAIGRRLHIPVTACKIEKKSSGASLIQYIRRHTSIPVTGIERNKDKVFRANSCVPHISTGNVWLPRSSPWLFDYKDEFRKFTPLMTHKHDDQIDPTLDAIEDMLVNTMAGAGFYSKFKKAS